MNPQEILPSPEAPMSPEKVHSGDELEASNDTGLEQKTKSSSAGAGIVSASAVDDAQGQVQGAMPVQNTDDQTQDDIINDLPATAEDIDLIEKEWVKKAKDIVKATYGDPYKQNQQINTMKVEYIKKRYNKELKTRGDK